MMYSFSIIIPHKNIPDLLERCLKSIPQRDDLQVIVVDDDSDDPPRHCGEHRHCGLDPQSPANSGDCGIRHNDGRIEFIYVKDPKRRGAGFARNIGLEHAKGKWLIFADADDFFLPDFEKMLDKYADSDADMICFANTAADSETLAPALEYSWSMTSKMAKARHGSARYTPPLFQEIAGQTYPDGLDVIRYDTGVVWCRFIKRELVEQYKIRFQETVCRNDTLFAVKIGCTAKTILLDETAIYCYTQRQGNTVDNFDFKYQKARYFVSKSVMKFLREQKNAAGIRIFDDDLLFWYEQLKQNKYLYIKEFIPVLLLTVTKKQLRKNFWTIVS